jgi:two-component system nitrate/nitrite response regulator NarP
MTKVAIIDKQRLRKQFIERQLDICKEYDCVVTMYISQITKQNLKKITPELAPDIAFLDLDENGIDGITSLLNASPKTLLIVYSSDCSYDLVRKAFQAGAVSFILTKNFAADFTASFIYTLKGDSFISPAVTKSIILHSSTQCEEVYGLSVREHQVIDEILDGASYKLIAFKYHLSLDTIRQYIKRSYRKLHINSKGELMAKFK